MKLDFLMFRDLLFVRKFIYYYSFDIFSIMKHLVIIITLCFCHSFFLEANHLASEKYSSAVPCVLLSIFTTPFTEITDPIPTFINPPEIDCGQDTHVLSFAFNIIQLDPFMIINPGSDDVMWTWDGPADVFLGQFAEGGIITAEEAATIPPGTYNVEFCYTDPSDGIECCATHTFTVLDGPDCLTLPVDLVYFESEQVDCEVHLKWATAQEIRNEGFFIQKSTDGRVWIDVDFVEGKGNSFDMTSYHYRDVATDSQSSYYRLKQLDFDGAMTYSDLIFLEFDNCAFEVSIHPNPSRGWFNLNIQNDSDQASTVVLKDICGSIFFSRSIDSSDYHEAINLVTPGVYVLTVRSGARVVNKRVVVE